MSRDLFLRNFRNSYFSESLEDENIKLLEMIRQREKTIKNLEVKTRNALEISIKADDGKTGRVRGSRLAHVQVEYDIPKLSNDNVILNFSNQIKYRSCQTS